MERVNFKLGYEDGKIFYRSFEPKYLIGVSLGGSFSAGYAKDVSVGMVITIPSKMGHPDAPKGTILYDVLDVCHIKEYFVPCSRNSFGKRFEGDYDCTKCAVLGDCLVASKSFNATTKRILEHSW